MSWIEYHALPFGEYLDLMNCERIHEGSAKAQGIYNDEEEIPDVE
jgi:hypothetical protein